MTANRVHVRVPHLDGILYMTYTDDWNTGATTYRVDGPRVSGTFVVAVHFHKWLTELDPDYPWVRIECGRRLSDGQISTFRDNERPDLPVVNRVPLTGSSYVFSLDKLRSARFTHRDWFARRPDGVYNSTAAPERTCDRAAAVVSAILRHWLTRPEAYPLRLTAAARQVARFGSRCRDVLAKRRQAQEHTATRIDHYQREYDERAAKIAQVEQAIADAAHLATAPPPVRVPAEAPHPGNRDHQEDTESRQEPGMTSENSSEKDAGNPDNP